jgi:hypothetical protein
MFLYQHLVVGPITGSLWLTNDVLGRGKAVTASKVLLHR